MSLLHGAGILWTALFAIFWLAAGWSVARSAWTGRLRLLGIDLYSQPIMRNDRPVRFWLYWSALAWPFVILPLLVVTGLILSSLGN